MSSGKSHAVSDAARAAQKPRAAKRNPRGPRVASLVHRAASEIIARGNLLRDPLLQDARLTVTEVEISRDLSHARVWVLPLAAASHAQHHWNPQRLKALQRLLTAREGEFGHALGNRTELKRTPKVELLCDRRRLHARELEDKLHRQARDRAREAPDAPTS